MGGVCCDARKRNIEPVEEFVQTKKKKQKKRPRKKRTNVEEKKNDTKNWKGVLGKFIVSSVLDAKKKEELDNSFSSEEEEEESFSIAYELNSATLMTRKQRSSIIQILDRFQNDEIFDSYSEGVHHGEVDANCTIGLTSHALYILDPEDFGIVRRRVTVESIVILFLDSKLSGMVIVIQDDENLLVSSEKISDIVKGVQEIHIEASNKVIPWKTEGNFEDLKKKMDLHHSVEIEDFEKHNILYIRLLELGKLNEAVLEFQGCSLEEGYFLMTNLTLYMLNKKHKIIAELAISAVKSIIVFEEKSVVRVNDGENSIEWSIPVEFCERIKNQTSKTGSPEVNIIFL